MKTTLAALLVLAAASSAFASPYFRPLNYRHPVVVAGVLIDPASPGDTSGASLVPLVTHSPADGCLLPTVVCEDYTPLAVGAALHAGKLTLDVAPLANILPWMVALADAAMPNGYQAAPWLKPSAGQAVTFSAGPVWEYQQRVNKGFFKIFTGLALHF